MPRPSLNADIAMLASGRALFAEHGCVGLSVRAVAEHAGVNPGLFHYHFGSKDQFLRTVLQSLYEEMFEQLSGAAHVAGAPLQRLRGVLILIGQFLLEHGPQVGRIWSDAGNGVPVAVAFVQNNAPRHLDLVTGLLEEADQAGELAPLAPMQRMAFLMGAVAAPILVVGRLTGLPLGGALPAGQLVSDVLSSEAIEARVDLALMALRIQKGTIQ
ncbi:TetR/AcrR family transcriptional regulator [Hydrogenophaga crassostreae]|nr:TetR/AcrR family transcriptional regulator [Hydrogenophaga crassostreae]